jgi:hypothetical protein
MYILGGMYFYVIMVYIVSYTDLTVFPVSNYPSYVRTTVTTPTMYMTTTFLLLSSTMSTFILLLGFPKLLQLLLLLLSYFIRYPYHYHTFYILFPSL